MCQHKGVRRIAMDALLQTAEMGDECVINTMVTCLTDGDADVREVALKAFRQDAGKQANRTIMKVVHALPRIMNNGNVHVVIAVAMCCRQQDSQEGWAVLGLLIEIAPFETCAAALLNLSGSLRNLQMLLFVVGASLLARRSWSLCDPIIQPVKRSTVAMLQCIIPNRLPCSCGGSTTRDIVSGCWSSRGGAGPVLRT